jgi:hypothetical protein
VPPTGGRIWTTATTTATRTAAAATATGDSMPLMQSLYDMGFDDEQNLNAEFAVHGNLNRAVDGLCEAAANY